MSFKKSLRNLKSRPGQASFEYIILLAIVVTLTVLGANKLLSKVTESGESVFQKAVTKILGQTP